MSKKIISLTLSILMIVCALPMNIFSATAAEHIHIDADKNNICDDSSCGVELFVDRSWDENKKEVKDTLTTIPSAKKISFITSTLNAGEWYYISGNVTPVGSVKVNGTSENPTHIILKDGAVLNANKGIVVADGNALCIYGQSNDSGKIVAVGDENSAGIGGGDLTNGGTINIYGGIIDSTGGLGAAGIGGGFAGDGGSITIYGGKITAINHDYHANAIGSGYAGNGGSFTMYGGEVTASCNSDKAGIGSADFSVKCDAFIRAGVDSPKEIVTVSDYAKSRYPYVNLFAVQAHTDADKNGVCDDADCEKELYVVRGWDEKAKEVKEVFKEIPGYALPLSTTLEAGRCYVASGNININDRIMVKGTLDRPTEIILKDGCSFNALSGIEVDYGYTLNIYGQINDSGELSATGSLHTAGIGGGEGKAAGNIIFHGGTISKAEGSFSAGIGAGYDEVKSVNFVMFGGNVTAVAGWNKVGLGSYRCVGSTSTITIYNGNLTARGHDEGGFGINGNVVIKGGTITATGIKGAGIGYSRGSKYNGNFTVESVDVIRAGSAAPGSITTVDNYRESRNDYVWIHNHVLINGVCFCGETDYQIAADKAIEQIEAAKTDANASVADKAIADLRKVTSFEEIDELLEKAFADMAAADKLAKVKAEAVTVIENAKTQNTVARAEKAVTDINAAVSEEAVNNIKTKALADMAILESRYIEKTEKIEFIQNLTAESEHFILETTAVTEYGWHAGGGNRIVIKPKAENVMITGFDGVVGFQGVYYETMEFSSGEMVEKDYVYSGATVHVINALTDNFEIVHNAGDTITFKDITIHYVEVDPHNHEFTGEYINNFDGTHIQHCVLCFIYGGKTEHVYDENGNCPCGAKEEVENAINEAIAEINAAKVDISEPIAEEALAAIRFISTKDEVIEFKNKTLAEMATLVKEVIEARAEAIVEINAAKSELNADVAEEAITDIGTALTVEAVNQIKTTALYEMAKPAALIKAKADSIKELNELKTELTAEIVEKAITDITAAETYEDVQFIFLTACNQIKDLEELISSRKNAIEEINNAKTEVNAAIAEKAIADINAAETAHDVYELWYNALEDMAAADALVKYKAEVISAINKAKTEANAAIAEKAIADINAAETADDVYAIWYYVFDDMEYADALAEYKSEAISEINEAKTNASASLAKTAITEIKAAETFESVNSIRTTALFNMAKVNAVDEINAKKTLANSYYANKALADINSAKTADEINSIKSFAILEMTKADAIDLLENEMEWYNAKVAFDAIEEIEEEADTVEKVNSILAAALEKMAELETFADVKQAAIDEIEDARTKANEEIAFRATSDIEDAETVEEVNKIKEKALSDMAKADAEEEERILPDVKTAAINEVKAAAGTNASDAVNAIVSKAEALINAENTIKGVNTVKASALDEIKAQLDKEASEKALAEAKISAIAEVRAAAEKVSDEVDPEGVDYVCAYLNLASSMEELETLKAEALEALALVLELKNARLSAIDEINAKKTNTNYEIAEEAITDIKAADTVESITAIKTKALSDMAKADEAAAAAKALAEAKTVAIAEINKAKTEANKAIAENAIADINAATTVENVTAIKTKALSDMKKADEDAAAAKALAEAKTAATNEIKATLTGDSTDAERALVDEAVKAVENAKSIAEVKNAKSDFVEKWKELHTQEDPEEPDNPSKACNHMCHKGGFVGFIWKIVRFFSKLFGTNKVCKCGAVHY